MSRDCFDLCVTNADTDAASGYDRYVTEFLSYGANLRELFTVADANPKAPLLNAHSAVLHMAFEGAEGWTAAAPYLARMRESARGANERERLFCAATEAWAVKDFTGALAHLEELTVRWPADLCALKWAQYHAFNLGDAKALLRFGERAMLVHENAPYAHGMAAFGLEQNHRLREAEEAGMYAAEIALDDAWAHHAVAHVLETEGRPKEGARWLDHCAHTWESKGVFIRDHNWWHVALFQLALGRETEALAIYDQHLWGAWPEFPQEQIGAVSMLWRLEMRGVDVGDRWVPVVEQARQRTDEHLFPFHDLHYLYALARAGNEGEADAFLTGLKNKATEGDANNVWGRLCVPAAQALMAFTTGKRADTTAQLAPILNDLYRIGGSHAQRHIFVETFEACQGDQEIQARQLI